MKVTFPTMARVRKRIKVLRLSFVGNVTWIIFSIWTNSKLVLWMANSYYYSTDHFKLFLRRSIESGTLLKYTCRNMLHKIRQLIKKTVMLSYGRMTMIQKNKFPCTLRFKLVCAIRYRYDLVIRDGSNVQIRLHCIVWRLRLLKRFPTTSAADRLNFSQLPVEGKMFKLFKHNLYLTD